MRIPPGLESPGRSAKCAPVHQPSGESNRAFSGANKKVPSAATFARHRAPGNLQVPTSPTTEPASQEPAQELAEETASEKKDENGSSLRFFSVTTRPPQNWQIRLLSRSSGQWPGGPVLLPSSWSGSLVSLPSLWLSLEPPRIDDGFRSGVTFGREEGSLGPG